MTIWYVIKSGGNVFKFKTLIKAHKEAKKKSEREHVTQFIINNNKFKKFNLLNNKDHSSIRLTLDEPEDLNVIKKAPFIERS
jgi:glutamate-1-semialdehyde 2,1-aminomutase